MTQEVSWSDIKDKIKNKWNKFTDREIESVKENLDLLLGKQSFLCLGMNNVEWYLKIPAEVVLTWPAQLNKTEKMNSKYWHLGLIEKNECIYLSLPKTGKLLDLTEFKVMI